MYSTCLFCHAPLGGNEAVERFPAAIADRLAVPASVEKTLAKLRAAGRA